MDNAEQTNNSTAAQKNIHYICHASQCNNPQDLNV